MSFIYFSFENKSLFMELKKETMILMVPTKTLDVASVSPVELKSCPTNNNTVYLVYKVLQRFRDNFNSFSQDSEELK